MENGLQKQETPKPKRRNYVKKVEHEWSHEETMRLIAAVEKRRLLWDMGTPEYKLPKVDAWQEVSNAIGNVKVDDAKGKWTNLRISFKHYLAKSKYRSKKSGQRTVGWRYFKSMMFLEANVIQQSTKSTPSLPQASANNDASVLADFPVAPPPSGIVIGKRKRRAKANPEPCPPLSPSPTPNVESMREVAFNALHSFTINGDRFSAFGQYVASELRALPPDQGVFVQRELNRELLRLMEALEAPHAFVDDDSGEDIDRKSNILLNFGQNRTE